MSGPNIFKIGSNLDEPEEFSLAESVKPSLNCIRNVDNDALKRIDKGERFDEFANVKKKKLKLNVKRGIKIRLVR